VPIFDLPLEQLRTYGGRNPRPDDFDEYWDRALAELAGIDANVELEPAAFRTELADCQHLRFTGAGGARIHAKYLRPHRQEPGPAVLLFHGYTGSSGDWFDKLPFAAAGFHVLALDVRGQGGQSEDRFDGAGGSLYGHVVRGLDNPERLFYRDVFLDCARLARIAADLPGVDRARIAAAGGSQGGGLTLACAALEPAVALAAPTYPFLSDYQRVWEMDLAIAAYEGLRSHFRVFDPLHEREAETFTRLGYIDVQHLAPRIRAEVLMVTALMDTVTPPSTQFAAYNKISAPKRMLLYPDHGHETLPGAADRIFEFLTKLL